MSMNEVKTEIRYSEDLFFEVWFTIGNSAQTYIRDFNSDVEAEAAVVGFERGFDRGLEQAERTVGSLNTIVQELHNRANHLLKELWYAKEETPEVMKACSSLHTLLKHIRPDEEEEVVVDKVKEVSNDDFELGEMLEAPAACSIDNPSCDACE
jgi:hypothetical protein